MNTIAQSASVSGYDPKVSRPPVCPTPWSIDWIAQKLLRRYNQLRHLMQKPRPATTDFWELADVRQRAGSITDIDEHLELMFVEALLAKPKLIVELGVRNGASTFVFERVACCCGSILISADLDDCSSISLNPQWHFFQGDDVRFAGLFREFCAARGIAPAVDLLFIDTSHYYDHTVQEIAAWFPHLSEKAKVMFHDTNLRLMGPRNDGCIALAWDNHRGVIRAVEEFLGIHLDERKQCIERAAGWLVRHWPNCNGFTILDRI
jgi:cephalosporin hydroxylase